MTDENRLPMSGHELLRRWQMKEYPDVPVLSSYAFEALARDINDMLKMDRASWEYLVNARRNERDWEKQERLIAELREINQECWRLRKKAEDMVARFQDGTEVESDHIPLDEPNDEMLFLYKVRDEIKRARELHPFCNLVAIAEETGEVARALQDEPLKNVYKECVQLACTAARVAIEGDPTIDPYRVSKGLEPTRK